MRRELRFEEKGADGAPQKEPAPFERLLNEGAGPIHEDVRQIQRASAGAGTPRSTSRHESSKGRGVMMREDESDDIDTADPFPDKKFPPLEADAPPGGR